MLSRLSYSKTVDPPGGPGGGSAAAPGGFLTEIAPRTGAQSETAVGLWSPLGTLSQVGRKADAGLWLLTIFICEIQGEDGGGSGQDSVRTVTNKHRNGL